MPIIVGVGGPSAFSSASGGKVYAYDVISEVAAWTVAPKNVNRVKITFHNPGPDDLFVFPTYVQNGANSSPSSPNGVPQLSNRLNPVTNGNLGGSFRVFGNGGTLELTGEVQGEWQAITVTGGGSGNPLTVLDTNT